MNLSFFTLTRKTGIGISELFNDIKCDALPGFQPHPLLLLLQSEIIEEKHKCAIKPYGSTQKSQN